VDDPQLRAAFSIITNGSGDVFAIVLTPALSTTFGGSEIALDSDDLGSRRLARLDDFVADRRMVAG